jgi:hypothetical protein
MVREIVNYIHTETESREAFQELTNVQNDCASLLNEYLDFERPLRGNPDYMNLRKEKLQEYKIKDAEIWDNFVQKYRTLGWDIGTEK